MPWLLTCIQLETFLEGWTRRSSVGLAEIFRKSGKIREAMKALVALICGVIFRKRRRITRMRSIGMRRRQGRAQLVLDRPVGRHAGEERGGGE